MIFRAVFWSAALPVLLGAVSCVRPGHSVVYQVTYDPPLARHAGQVVEGRTTGAQIQEWFGIPYFQADGPHVTIYADSPMMRSQRNSRVQELVDEYANLIAYSSLGDEHVVLFYIETAFPGLESLVYGGEMRCLRNKMFIMINKKTDVVEEFCYRQEFKPK